MRKKWIWLLLAFLPLSACGADLEAQEEDAEESDPFGETYHLRDPIENGMIPRVEGIKACFDAMKERPAVRRRG